MDIRAWLERASADAESRGLRQLRPLLETLARSTQALRDADREFGASRRSTDDDDDPCLIWRTRGATDRAPHAVARRAHAGVSRSHRGSQRRVARVHHRPRRAGAGHGQAGGAGDRQGRYRGALHGIPVSVKDLVDIAGVPTTSGSAVPRGCPATTRLSSTNLRRAGAVIIGKTNLHEFAFGTTSDETAFGAVGIRSTRRVRRRIERRAQRSRSSKAWRWVRRHRHGRVDPDPVGRLRDHGVEAVDTPRFDCEGVVPLSTTLDHVGPMTRTVADASVLFAALARQCAPRVDEGGDRAGGILAGRAGAVFPRQAG